MGGCFDGPLKYGPCQFALLRIEGVFIKRANGGNAQAKGFRVLVQILSVGFPLRVLDAAGAFVKTDPFYRPKTKPAGPFQFINIAPGQYANSHSANLDFERANSNPIVVWLAQKGP